MRTRWMTIGLITATIAVATGCASKFNRENFRMIQVGVDDREDVATILGEPEAKMDDVWLYDDLDRRIAAQIFFGDDGRVLSKEWMDAGTGEWDGQSPYTDPPPGGETREETTRTRTYDVD